MTRSSLTEETPSTPGWVEGEANKIFAPLGEDAVAVRNDYLDCLAGVRGAVDSDAGHDRCRSAALASLEGKLADLGDLDRALQALEAEISRST
jgi:hypothetical protein